MKSTKCLNCNKETNNPKYCSNQCQRIYQSDNLYKDYLNTPEKYCNVDYCLKSFKKRFLKEQDNKCAICKILDSWNGKKLILVMDHIDGDASNNRRENIRLICPNCDSQLDTYKSKNKNSARKERYIKNYKN